MYEIQMKSDKENRQLESQKKKYLATLAYLEAGERQHRHSVNRCGNQVKSMLVGTGGREPMGE